MKTPSAKGSYRVLPAMPSWARYVFAGCIVACFAYALSLLDRVEQAEQTPDLILEEQVTVPALDEALLAKTRDATRQDRLLIEKEPLAHLLAEALDVGPSVAAALDMPAEMVPIADLRAATDAWRHRWLYYEGVLVQLSGPKGGHPVDGYSVFEATVRLASGESVFATFSMPPLSTAAPSARIAIGDWVRVEGYLMKLRDTSYPEKLERSPLLVGRSIEQDYEDWPAVEELDAAMLEGLRDDTLWPGDLAWRSIEEDQTEALWHLGAFARDTADQWSLADWRKIEPLSVAEPYDRLVKGEVARGEPMRVFGTLIRRRTVAAPANPANSRYWTTAWIQASSFGGHLIPVWVPSKVDELPMRAQLEVRGFYYRWYVYDGQEGARYRVPLFVAANLDEFDLKTEEHMRGISVGIGCAALLLLISLLWGQRRATKSSLQHSRDMDARRRRRRQAAAGAAPDAEAP